MRRGLREKDQSMTATVFRSVNNLNRVNQHEHQARDSLT